MGGLSKSTGPMTGISLHDLARELRHVRGPYMPDRTEHREQPAVHVVDESARRNAPLERRHTSRAGKAKQHNLVGRHGRQDECLPGVGRERLHRIGEWRARLEEWD